MGAGILPRFSHWVERIARQERLPHCVSMGSNGEMDSGLPIEDVRDALLEAVAGGPVVLTAPPGSGKSTQVPRWCKGPVLVVEPRRVACRSLAERVAELDGTELGRRVGYHVRDERRAQSDTQILFATPGIVLRRFDDIAHYATVILDEFHERSLETDLILALLRARYKGRLLVMSATLDAGRLAAHLGGVSIEAKGRLHPVEVHYAPSGSLLPEPKGIEDRVVSALDEAREVPGDVLVFLPGKAEIAQCASRLAGQSEFDVVELHGGLSLDQQRRAFEEGSRRRVILSTNVAETSVTLPGIGVVIDSGLVRRTVFHRDRGFLALVPIAMDSAEQRAGRAGRTRPGVCYRLWSPTARLESGTPPEIHRESIVPLLLAAGACGIPARDLDFLDPPKDYALEAATEELVDLGAIDATGAITERGRQIFGLPLSAPLARLLVEAGERGTLEDAVDLVGALSVDRPLFASGQQPVFEEDNLRACGCDATAFIRAVRWGDPRQHGLNAFALREARHSSRRLRKALGLSGGSKEWEIDRQALARTAMAADSRCVHMARTRKRQVAFSNGGTELVLGRESALKDRKGLVAVAVLDTRAIGSHRDRRIVITCALPLELRWIAEAGLGRDRLASVKAKRGVVLATIERVHAKMVLTTREEVPHGALAREAIRDLFLRGSLFRKALKTSKARLEATALASRLNVGIEAPPSLDDWLLARLEELGVEDGRDLSLLSEADLTAPDVPFEVRGMLEDQYPRTVDLGDSCYAVDYDLERRQVILRMTRGKREKPPPLGYLPKFEGFSICIEAGRTMHVLRDR